MVSTRTSPASFIKVTCKNEFGVRLATASVWFCTVNRSNVAEYIVLRSEIKNLFKFTVSV